MSRAMKCLPRFVIAVTLCFVQTAILQAPTADAATRNQRAAAQRQPTLQQVMAKHPQGGAALTKAVLDLVRRNPKLAADVASASKGASLAQQTALGAALGQASVVLAADPVATAAIAAAVAASPSPVQTAFAQGQATATRTSSGEGGGGSSSGGGGGTFTLIPTTSGAAGSSSSSPQ